jgi:hypothetical protein
MMERVNLTKIYCKHFCKCHNVPPEQLYDNNFFKMSLTRHLHKPKRRGWWIQLV